MGETLLYQDKMELKKNKSEYLNKKLVNGTLQITVSSDEDFDNYYCEFMLSPMHNPSVNHTIVKVSPPQIISLLPENNKTVVSN